jgi:hypothetical protein
MVYDTKNGWIKSVAKGYITPEDIILSEGESIYLLENFPEREEILRGSDYWIFCLGRGEPRRMTQAEIEDYHRMLKRMKPT